MGGFKCKWGSNFYYCITGLSIFHFFKNSQQKNEVFLLRISLGNVNASVITSRYPQIYNFSFRKVLGTKFRIKMTLLNFWIKLTQKRYFRTKNMKITIEFYIVKIQILNLSFNKQFWFLEQKSRGKVYFRSKTQKMNITIEFFIFKLV